MINICMQNIIIIIIILLYFYITYYKFKLNINKIDRMFENLPSIPKKIHISWKEKNVLNLCNKYSILQNGICNLKKMNPEWEFIIYDDYDIDEYLKINLELSDYNLIKDKKIVEKTDLWRLLIIYNIGGMYQDIDRLYNIPLSKIIKKNTKCILPIYKHLNYSQDIMISCPSNPIHKKAIELNINRRRAGEKNIVYLGPNTYLHAVSKVLFNKQIKRIHRFKSLLKQSIIIKKSKYLDTKLEIPLYNTLTYQGPKVKFDKQDFYNYYNVIHHSKK